MKNRKITPEELYALERSARAERAKEVARLFAALVRRMGRLVPHVSPGRKVVPHA
jgi:hypothetical protein